MTPGHRDLRTNKHGAAAQAADEQEWGGGGVALCSVQRQHDGRGPGGPAAPRLALSNPG